MIQRWIVDSGAVGFRLVNIKANGIDQLLLRILKELRSSRGSVSRESVSELNNRYKTILKLKKQLEEIINTFKSSAYADKLKEEIELLECCEAVIGDTYFFEKLVELDLAYRTRRKEEL